MAKMTKGGKMVSLFLLIALVAGGYWKWYSSHPHPKAAEEATAQSSDGQAEEVKSDDVPESQKALTITGSSVINDDFSPSVVKAYMAKKNYSDIKVFSTGKKERAILGTLNGKVMRFDIKSPGTKDGFAALGNNSADICMASAQAEPELRSNAQENVIGLDGIAVITNQGNTLRGLFKEDIQNIYAGRITDWSQIPGAKVSGPIKLYRMGDKTGIYKMFKELVMGGTDLTCTAFEKSQDMVNAIGNDMNGIGFVSFTLLSSNSSVKAIPLAEAEGMPFVSPNKLTIASEKYLLCRRLYMYRPATSNNAIASDLSAFIASTEGQSIIQSSGFVNLSIEKDDQVEVAAGDPPAYKRLIGSAHKISTEFHFNTGSQNLDVRGLDDIERLVAYLNPGDKIVLVGFADNTGDPAKNMILSKQRAEAVARKLSDEKGIPVSSTIGMGILRPVRQNSSEANRAFNRRVEVWIQ